MSEPHLKLIILFGHVKAVHLLINIHKRGRKCLQKANVGLLTEVMMSCIMWRYMGVGVRMYDFEGRFLECRFGPLSGRFEV